MYKLVLDMLERYYLECESPFQRGYKRQLLPFAQFFYQEYTPALACTQTNETQAFAALKHASVYFKKQYPSKFWYFSSILELVLYDSLEEYAEYYEGRRLESDNKSMSRKECLL